MPTPQQFGATQCTTQSNHWRIFYGSVFLASFLVGGSIAQTPKTGVVIPGESVAGLKLGATLSDFQALFPKQPGIDEDFAGTMQDGCPERSYHWIDLSMDATGVFALFHNAGIYQLSVQTPRFSLSNGISFDSSASAVMHTYPFGKEYVLLGSGGERNGGKNLHYWVDKPAGVAFELYWNKHHQRRQVSAITIFRKGGDYLPDGCISPPQQWREVQTLHAQHLNEAKGQN